MKYTVLFCVLIFSTPTFSQSTDTVFIYFEFGSHKIQVDQSKKIGEIPKYYNLNNVDSIHFIGRTDSVGSIKDNLKLSSKRANNVYKRTRFFIADIPYRTYAEGEAIDKKKDSLNRRVEVVLFYPSIVVSSDSVVEDSQYLCYHIDYILIEKANLTEIKRNGRSYIMLEWNIRPSDRQLYYSVFSADSIVHKRLRYQRKASGSLWWRKIRFRAYVPKESYERNRIYYLKAPPCDSCLQGLNQPPFQVQVDSCIRPAHFLMDNSQIKQKVFQRNTYVIRVPKEYVHNDFVYFDYGSKDTLVWETRKGFGRRRYYYTEKQTNGNYVSGIGFRSDCCLPTVSFNSSTDGFWRCGGVRNSQSGIPIPLQFDIGIRQFKGNSMLHFSYLVNLNFNSFEVYIIPGINQDLKFTGIVGANFLISELNKSTVFKPGTWYDSRVFNSYIQTSDSRRRLLVYLGAEQEWSYLNPLVNVRDVHFGFALRPLFNSEYSRLYLQGGYQQTVIESDRRTGLNFRAGIQFRLEKPEQRGTPKSSRL